MWLLGLLLTGFVLIAPWWAVVVVRRQRRELRALRERLDLLELQVTRERATLAAVPPPGAPVAPAAAPAAEPIPFPRPAPPVRPAALPGGATAPPAPRDETVRAGAPAAAAPPAAGPAPPVAAPPIAGPARGFDSSRAEELVGSIWLQNAGALLLLLGVFFLILWGYTTGRFGPGVLVAAGVTLGMALAWRGDRMARSLPLFGHALIGIGLGTVYLSLYLGHFTLHALPRAAAFSSLTLVSIASVAAGLRYRAQTIAALGVLGAFVPQLVAAWIPLRGFTMSAPGMLAYLAAVDAVVFLLAARAGWSGLGLAALFMSALTWIAQFADAPWSWSVQAGLATLFAALGLSPLPRLVRSEGRVRGVDLAVIALAPFCLLAAAWPLLASAPRVAVATHLLALAVAYLLAALWVDGRRTERDLWRPLTGAAVVFLTGALERAVGREHTPMAWCVEGTLLVWLGLRPRGVWLRLCGHAVAALGALGMLGMALGSGAWSRDQLPVLYPAGLRDLVCLLTVLAGAWLLGRGRTHLTVGERRVPEIWTGVGNLMLLVWAGREAVHLASALEGEGGRWAGSPAPGVPRGGQRLHALAASLLSVTWLAHAAVLVVTGRRPGRGFLRVCGYAAGALGTLVLFVGQNLPDGWSDDQLPIVHPTGMSSLSGVALIAAVAVALARRRERLGENERRMPEAWTLAASLLLLGWIALEADHLARSMEGIPGVWARHGPGESRAALARVRVLGASFTSAGWLLQALGLLALGWMRRSAFLRWAGLGLAGITVLKFLALDMQAVDVFWRFLTAIVVGAALLGISYAYQRRARPAASDRSRPS